MAFNPSWARRSSFCSITPSAWISWSMVPELTPGRAGVDLYTWRGIHQTLIPLSKQYMTLAAAQATS
jgi:hypothetical protein